MYERQGKTKTDHTHKARHWWERISIVRERLHSRFGEWYKSVLKRYLQRGILRWAAVLIPIVLLVCSFVFLSPKIGFSLFPSGDNPYSTLTISTKKNSTIDTITPYIEPLEAYLSSVPEIKLYKIRLSNDTISTLIELHPKEYRKDHGMRLADDVSKEIRDALNPLKSQ